MIKLNDLKFACGSMKKKKRMARGNSGKSHGRGEKGQKARSGVSLSNFQGGQTPIERRVPKHNSFFVKKKTTAISLKNLEKLFDSKLIEEGVLLNRELLVKLRVVKKDEKFKFIGDTSRKVNLEAHSFTKGAKESIEKSGGSAKVLEK